MDHLPDRSEAGRLRTGRTGVRPVGDAPAFRSLPYSLDEAIGIEKVLGIGLPAATTLVRRGIGTPEEATRFLAADEHHPATAFEGIEEVAATILDAVRSGRQITIYGDYDADGVCATAILVGLLRELGGKCDWLIPDRITEGYGLSPEQIEVLAKRGTDLIVTVDCGVGSIEEVALAKRLGMEIVITDHHRFGPELPDCPVLHPVVSGYPYPSLCGAGVAAKLASVIRNAAGLDGAGDEADLDLVALATVADMMPLDGENRRLVKEGTAVARRAGRLGMRALMAASGVEPVALTAGDFGFRLGPRVNAVGRMYRADAGVELFLTPDLDRATEIGKELSRANTERKEAERQVETAADRAFRETHPEDASVIVVADEEWHQGVVGIVAARLVRRHGLPAVVITTSGETAKGSARSVPGLDLHEAISEVSEILITFGGHSAAAGLTVSTDRIDEFREALDTAVAARTGGGPVRLSPEVDAFIGGGDIDLDGAERIAALEPFGNGNRPPCLVIPGALIEDLREMGEGQHCRFSIVSGGHRASGVAFGRKSFPGSGEKPLDLMGELSINHWKGSSEPRFQVTSVSVRPEGGGADLPSAGDEEWWNRFEAALDGRPLREEVDPPACDYETVQWSGSAEAVMAQVASSGSRTLVVTSEAFRRWSGLGGPAISRFLPEGDMPGGGAVAGLWAGSPLEELSQIPDQEGPRLLLIDFETLGATPGVVGSFGEVVLFDPPGSERDLRLAAAGGARLHRTRDPGSLAFSISAAAERFDPVPQLRQIYRAAREDGGLTGPALLGALKGDSSGPRSPERAASLLKVMIEADIISTEGNGPARVLEVVSSEEIVLEKSAEYRALSESHEEQVSFIRQSDNRTR